jgi:hypothetical protein
MVKKGARRIAGGGGSGQREATVMAPEMVELRDELARALGESVEQTLDAVCARFEAVHASASRKRTGPVGMAADPLADYDMYHDCCARLVRYIEANMETSPEFAQQMERVILACHSNAAEPVLRSVVTKDLWFHRRREGVEADSPVKRDKAASTPSRGAKQQQQVVLPPMTRLAEKRTTRSADRSGVTTRLAEKKGVATRSLSSDRARVSTRSAEKRSAGTRTRSGSREPSPPPKRPRRAAAARVVLDSESSEEAQEEEDAQENEVVSVDGDEEDEEEEEEEEAEEEEPAKPHKGRRGRPSQPHYEQADELLLNFKDTIGELCYPDRRTPEQTKFFKERLRRSIEFVDAQLCKPPTGQFCSRDCKKLRAVMCNGDKPCKNKTCRIWHDVEVHTDCCENPQCEFKNRIMLRETMHKIEHAKQDLQRSRAELQVKRKHLANTKHGDQNDREKLVETTLLENEISQLETDIEEADEELGRLTATRKAFLGILNEIGVKISDDIADEFPDFDTHYSSRRPLRKSKTPQKSKRSVSPTLTPPARKSERVPPRRRGSGPHDESNTSAPARTTRRSTRSTQDTEAQVIDVDEEEETKEGDNDVSQAATDESQNGTRGDRSEGLTEATPAVGFTLRTNLPAKAAAAEKPASNQEAEPVQESAPIGPPDASKNSSTESAQSQAAGDEEREIQEETEGEYHEETEVERAEEVVSVHHEEVVTKVRDETVVERREKVVVERHEEVVVEHHKELEQHEEGVREEASFDAHDDQGEEEEENAFSAMNARWPGGL